MNDNEIDKHRIAGDISLILENGTYEEKQSLGRVIRSLNPNWKEILDSYNIILEN